MIKTTNCEVIMLRFSLQYKFLLVSITSLLIQEQFTQIIRTPILKQMLADELNNVNNNKYLNTMELAASRCINKTIDRQRGGENNNNKKKPE